MRVMPTRRMITGLATINCEQHSQWCQFNGVENLTAFIQGSLYPTIGRQYLRIILRDIQRLFVEKQIGDVGMFGLQGRMGWMF